MSLKKLGIALLAVFAFGAIAANSAFAENGFEETGATWTYNNAPLGVGVKKELKVHLAEGTTKSTLETTVAGQELDLTATGIECIECTIENKTGTVATADGFLQFTGVTVTKPLNCSVPGGTIKTKALTAILGMGPAGSTKDTVKFTPQSGTTFALVELTGASCPISGTYKVTGTQFAESAANTGVTLTDQKITASAAIQKSAGTASSLKFGENAATLTGSIEATIIGGGTFGAEK
jgi:hypothetical protein